MDIKDNTVLCHCMHVTAEEIRKAFESGAKDFKQIQEKTGCSTCCGTCENDIRSYIKELQSEEKQSLI